MKDTKKAKIIEIFSSIQGEGIYVGRRQTFIRFGGCNLKCIYCDVPVKIKIRELFVKQVLDRVQKVTMAGKKNRAVSARKRLSKDRLGISCGDQTMVSLTGGEPLCQAEFLTLLLPELKKTGYMTYLETNGTLFKQLDAVIKWIDVIAMDLKLSSSTGDKTFWREHRQFLKAAFSSNKTMQLFVKVIVTASTKKDDFKKAVKLVKSVESKEKSGIPFMIQPVWPTDKVKKQVSLKRLLEFEFLAGRDLSDVRIIPQIHKVLGCR